jgi:hypothetical protein
MRRVLVYFALGLLVFGCGQFKKEAILDTFPIFAIFF